jgi:hypothetical protein
MNGLGYYEGVYLYERLQTALYKPYINDKQAGRRELYKPNRKLS